MASWREVETLGLSAWAIQDAPLHGEQGVSSIRPLGGNGRHVTVEVEACLSSDSMQPNFLRSVLIPVDGCMLPGLTIGGDRRAVSSCWSELSIAEALHMRDEDESGRGRGGERGSLVRGRAMRATLGTLGTETRQGQGIAALRLLRDSFVGRLPENQRVTPVKLAWQELWGKAARFLSKEDLSSGRSPRDCCGGATRTVRSTETPTLCIHSASPLSLRTCSSTGTRSWRRFCMMSRGHSSRLGDVGTEIRDTSAHPR
jgi:hypothetical protein